MVIETTAPIRVSVETPEIRGKRTSSTLRQYAKTECEEPVWGDISEKLHEGSFNQLFASLDEKGMIRDRMVALFFGSHEGYDVRFFRRFVDNKGYQDVEILALEMADRRSKVPGVEHIRGDAVYSPLAPGSVDLIVDRLAATYTSFRYYPESGPQVLAEAHRILRTGGNLILDGGDLIKVQRINTWGSSATQIGESHPELFQQMENGFVHLVSNNNEDYRFRVRQFDVLGVPNQWGQIELQDGNGKWLHYQFTKV